MQFKQLFIGLTLASALLSADPFAYVLNMDNTVTPVDLLPRTTETPISGAFSNPIDIAITPDGRTAYVVSQGNNSVVPIDISTNQPLTSITTGFDLPSSIAITPNGAFAYVTNSGSNSVTPINLANNTALAQITGFSSPRSIAINPAGTLALVGGQGEVVGISLPSNAILFTINTSFLSPSSIAFTPDGRTAYLAYPFFSLVVPFDVQTESLLLPVVGTFVSPFQIAITPDGKTGYVTNIDGGFVTPFNVATNVGETPITGFVEPDDIAITSDGTTAYVTDVTSNELIPINLATNTPKTPITGNFSFPTALALTPTFNTPTNLQGKKIKNQFLLQSDLINQLTWSAIFTSPAPLSYNIYRDNLSNLIGTVNAGAPTVFLDHNRQKGTTYTYFLVAVFAGGQTSTPATITF